MNKNFSTSIFLISLFFFNTGFIFKPKLSAFYCGDYNELVKSTQDLLKQQEEILIFDRKGNTYQYDYYSNKVSREKLRVVQGVNFNLKESYLEGSSLYMNYDITLNSVPAKAQIILDYKRKTFDSSFTIYGSTEYMPTLNCKEINFPKDTKFEY